MQKLEQLLSFLFFNVSFAAVLVLLGCSNRVIDWVANTQRHLLLCSRGWKFKVRVPAWSGEGPPSAHGLLPVFSHGGTPRELSGSLSKGTNPIHKDSILMT